MCLKAERLKRRLEHPGSVLTSTFMTKIKLDTHHNEKLVFYYDLKQILFTLGVSGCGGRENGDAVGW